MYTKFLKYKRPLFYHSNFNYFSNYKTFTELNSDSFKFRSIRFYSKSNNYNTQSVSDCEIDSFCDLLEQDKHSWWKLYVRGEVPDYEPRKKMFKKLTSEGVDVECMEAHEIEDFTRWLLMREVHGIKYPKFPYDITLEQKIEDLKRRFPLK